MLSTSPYFKQYLSVSSTLHEPDTGGEDAYVIPQLSDRIRENWVPLPYRSLVNFGSIALEVEIPRCFRITNASHDITFTR